MCPICPPPTRRGGTAIGTRSSAPRTQPVRTDSGCVPPCRRTALRAGTLEGLMMNPSTSTRSPRARFRELLTGSPLTIMPGGFSPLYAKMAEQAGFDCFFVAGSQTAAFLYGLPDMGVLGLRDMVDHTRHVQSRVNIPILVDGDTGYGNATNVFYAVQEFVRAGVAGVQIEDQEAPKKSATMAG